MSEDNPLLEYIRTHPPKPFRVHPHYSALGDFVAVYFENADAYADQLTPEVIVYRDMMTHAIVGVKINDVKDRVIDALFNAPPAQDVDVEFDPDDYPLF